MRTIITGPIIASLILIVACDANETKNQSEIADGSDGSEEVASPSNEADGSCTEETIRAKVIELGKKMQEMAGDPKKMQGLSDKMMELQKKVEFGSTDGSFTIEQACDAYDDLLTGLK